MIRFCASVVVGLLFSATALGQFVAERSIRENESLPEGQVMSIAVFDATSKAPVEADLKVNGLNPRKPVEMKAVTDTSFTIKNYRLYSVSCVKPGYMLYSEKFWPDEASVHHQEVALQPLSLGLKTDIPDIVFLGDKTEIYHKSKPALDNLLEFLNVNNTVAITIIGHVNGPDNERSQRVYQKASLERAKSIKAYLTERGIADNRLEVLGAGNSQMIYPNPVTEWQNEANRRIEIEVTGL